MTDFLLALSGVLAVWRVTHLLVAEDGPWRVAAWLRARAGVPSCFDCASVFVALAVAALAGRGWRLTLLAWLALSGAAMVLDRFMERRAAQAEWHVE